MSILGSSKVLRRLSLALLLLGVLSVSVPAQAQFQGYSSSAVTSGSAVILGGNDTSVCFDDAGVLNCGSTGLTFTKSSSTLGLGGPLAFTETTAPSGSAGVDVCWGDAPSHALKCNNNNGGAVSFVLVAVTPTANALTKFTGVNGNVTNSSITDNGTTVSTTEPFSTTQSITLTEIAAPAGVTGSDVIWGDSTAHTLKTNSNNTSVKFFVLSTNSLSSGVIPKATGTNANTAGSSITDNGTTVSTTEPLSAAGLTASNGHVISTGTAPTASSCGTTPTVGTNSTDGAGNVTIGSGTVTSCTITFAAAFANAPDPVCGEDSTTGTFQAIRCGATTTALTITAATNMAGDKIHWIAIGH